LLVLVLMILLARELGEPASNALRTQVRARASSQFRAFFRRAWHYEDVGKRSDSRPGQDGEAQPTLPSGDVAFVFGKDANGVHNIRRRAENAPIEAGLLQPLVEGKPITGELISMKRREDMPMLFDVKSELPHDEGRTGTGPSKVATDSYRKGWDAIWGGRGKSKAPRGDLN
jgi:hypothetical protein